MSSLTIAGTGIGSMVDALKPGAALLRFMVIASVLTWARDSEKKKYGWWASAMLGDPEGAFGSLLWKLSRAKREPDFLARVVTYVDASLAWMKRRGVAEQVYVQTAMDGDRVWLKVTIERGTARTEIVFDDLWKGVQHAVG